MKRRKTLKKGLSLLLAILLVVGVLPISALAAAPTTKEEAELKLKNNPAEYVTMDVMAAKVLHHGETGEALTQNATGIRNGYVGNNTLSPQMGYSYNSIALNDVMTEGDDANYLPIESEANTAALKALKEKANKLFQDETNKGETALEVEKGKTFYVAFNLKGTFTSKKGLVGGSISLAFPDEAFTTNVTTTGGAIVNTMVSGTGNNFTASIDQLGNVPDYYKYGGSYSIVEPKNGVDFDGGQKGLSFTFKAGMNYYLPTEAEWLVVVPVTVKTDAEAGSYYIGCSLSDGSKGRTAINWSDITNGQDGISSAADLATATDGNLQANAIEVKVISKDPSVAVGSATVAPENTATIDVILTNGKFKKTQSESNYSIIAKSKAGTPAITKAEYKNDTTVTLTLTGADLTEDQDYQIGVKAGAYDATSGTASDLTTSNSFQKAKSTDATVALSNETTANDYSYGETLTATVTYDTTPAASDNKAVTYKWYRGSDVIEGASGSTHKIGKDDVEKQIKCEVSFADTFGKAESAAVTTTKKELTAPDADAIGKVPSITAGTTTLTVDGTYTFSAGVVDGDTVTAKYKATYDDSNKGSNKNVTVKFSDTGYGLQNGMDAYYTCAFNQLTVSTGEAVDEGYQVSLVAGKNADNADTSATFSTVNTLQKGDDAVPITISGLKDYEAVTADDLTITANGDKDVGKITEVTYEKKATTATFKYTPPAERDPDEDSQGAKKETITITLTPSRDVMTLTADDIEVTGDHTKPYDGKKNVTITENDTLAIAVKANVAYTAKPVTLSTTFTYDSEAAGTKDMKTGEVDVAANSDGTDNTAYYNIDAAVKNIAHTVTTGITRADATGVTAEASGVKTDEASALAALKGAAVKITTADLTDQAGGEVEDVIDSLNDTQLTNLINQALIDEGYKTEAVPTVADVTVDGSTGSTSLTATQKIGGKVALENVPAGATVEVKSGETLPEGITLEGTDLLIGEGATEGNATVKLTVTPTDDSPYELEITVTVEAAPAAEETADYAAAAGKTITVTISKANLKDTTNFALQGKVDLTFTMKFKSKSSPSGSSGYGVSYDTKGFGEASATYGETDEEGKIDILPTVSNVKLGATFLGWSTDGTKAHIVDPATYTTDQDVTLTAVYEGYMAGNKNSDGTVTADATDQITRGQLARMLVVASGQYDADADYGTPSYSDAKSGWYVPYIARAEELGILHGDGNAANTVRPNDPVTRQEASIMIAKAFGVDVTVGGTTDKVTDFDKVAKWAQDAVAALCNNGTINGYDDQTFRGGSNISRAEAAQMINMYLGLTEADKEAIKADSSIVSPFPDVKTKNWMYANIMFASLSVPSSYYTTEITMPTAE